MRTSYSALSMYQNCPLSYHLSYTLKADAHMPENPAAARGTRLHLSVEKYLKGEMEEKDLPFEFSSIMEQLGHYKAVGAESEETWLTDRGWNFQIEADDETMFKAIVDIHWVDEGILYIRDFKSGRAYPEHAKQLELYAAMGFAKDLDIERVSMAAIYLEGMGSETVYTRVLAPFLQEHWAEEANKLFSDTKWEATPGPTACRWCPFVQTGHCDSPWGKK